MLHADVEAELQRVAGAGGITQLFVERLLDAGDAVAVDIREAEHMDGERALRIAAALLAVEIQAGHAETVHFIQTGRASCRERVGPCVYISVVGASLKKTKKKKK